MTKICSICKNSFETNYKSQNICSFNCRKIAQKDRSKISMRRIRNKERLSFKPCEICQYKIVTELHHEANDIHYLCPNHHALITRNYATLQEMLLNPSKW